MKVLKPSKNKITQGYSTKHKGYDHSGKGDKNYYSSFHGVVVQAKNSETKNWINNGTLTTEDYGNYVKLKAQVDGKTVYQLGAHFETNSVLKVGTEVKKGQVVAQIGNTGNSTGAHSHTEYRDENNKNFPVEFVDETEEEKPPTEMKDKKQEIIDAHKATTGVYPNDDEINADLQQNRNLLDLIEGKLHGDHRAKERWLSEWGISQTDTKWEEIAKSYQDTFQRLKEIYGLTPADNTEEVLGFAIRSVERIKELEKQQEPKTIYKYEGKDFEVYRFLGFKLLIERK